MSNQTNKMGTTIKDTSKKVSVVGGGRGRVRGLCAAAPRCVRAAFAARTRAFGANTIKFRGGKWDEFGLAARARGRARGACSQRREYLGARSKKRSHESTRVAEVRSHARRSTYVVYVRSYARRSTYVVSGSESTELFREKRLPLREAKRTKKSIRINSIVESGIRIFLVSPALHDAYKKAIQPLAA